MCNCDLHSEMYLYRLDSNLKFVLEIDHDHLGWSNDCVGNGRNPSCLLVGRGHIQPNSRAQASPNDQNTPNVVAGGVVGDVGGRDNENPSNHGSVRSRVAGLNTFFL